ncbi:MAG TPA: NADH-quinone oxidoreductase subunit L [Verrucomicrobiae bacterium]|nr:NADH-quinone oxidoreductase subunit L [Verrucomicrobiae bacterium]
MGTNLLRWIPLLPLIGAVLNIFFGRWWDKKLAGILASAAVFGSFALSLQVFALLSPTTVLHDTLFTWIDSEPFKAQLSFQADALTAVMLLVVTGIGFLIHIYSTGYMAHDEGEARFFAYLNLFVFFMSVLVLADNLLLLFVGWEGVGLCSYLLIGFWFEDHANTSAGNKAFIVNRIGDFGFLLGVLLLFSEMNRLGAATLDFASLKQAASRIPPESVTLITLLLFVGATGKSAQIPLYVWLPDAMQGPTPVSALIHAATMVTAGVYMTARLSFLFVLAPATLSVIAIVGAATALLAGTIAVAQNDIKRVLAYSTVSQLGYMFLAAGVGAFGAAVFHLFTHAFFKACLFLGAGSVIHAMGGEQDMRNMGGLRRGLPITYWTYLIAGLALAGIPPTAGFFSKDRILLEAYSSAHGSFALWVVGWITAGLTAFYMFRQLFMVFHGQSRAPESVQAHVHESAPAMTVPLIVLALGSITAGWLALPSRDVWDPWLQGVLGRSNPAEQGEVANEMLLVVLTVGLALLGIALAYFLYGRERRPAEDGPLWRVLAHKYYIDEFYDRVFVRPFTAAANWFARVFDPGFIDGAVNGVAGLVRAVSSSGRMLQSGNVQHYLFAFLIGTILVFVYWLRW